MIEFGKGNIFDGAHTVLVNPVNCLGVMGKGLALQFKNLSINNYRAYLKACASKDLRIGKCFVYEELPGCFVVNFPTKFSWRNPSKLEYISQGLDDLREFLEAKPKASVGIPALGCGLGGLDWSEVKPLMTDKLASLECSIRIYAE